MWPFSRVVKKEIKVSKANINHWLEQGVDANIIVFDSDAPKGVPTKRLMALMRTIARSTYKHNIKAIYMDKRDAPVASHSYWIMEYKITTLDWSGLKVQETFKEMEGTMARDDEKLVIGILENEQVLLGSY